MMWTIRRTTTSIANSSTEANSVWRVIVETADKVGPSRSGPSAVAGSDLRNHEEMTVHGSTIVDREETVTGIATVRVRMVHGRIARDLTTAAKAATEGVRAAVTVNVHGVTALGRKTVAGVETARRVEIVRAVEIAGVSVIVRTDAAVIVHKDVVAAIRTDASPDAATTAAWTAVNAVMLRRNTDARNPDLTADSGSTRTCPTRSNVNGRRKRSGNSMPRSELRVRRF